MPFFISAAFALAGVIIYGLDYWVLYRQIYPDPTILNHRFGYSFGLCITGAILFALAGINELVVLALIIKANKEFGDSEDEGQQQGVGYYYTRNDAEEAIATYDKNNGHDSHDELPRGVFQQF